MSPHVSHVKTDLPDVLLLSQQSHAAWQGRPGKRSDTSDCEKHFLFIASQFTSIAINDNAEQENTCSGAGGGLPGFHNPWQD